MITLKKLEPGSEALLSRLWTETFVQAYADVHSAENIRAYCAAHFSLRKAVDTLENPHTHCIAAFSNGEAAGYYIIKTKSCPYPLSGRSFELKQIYILAEYYGAGLGRGLYDDAVEYMRAQNANWIWLAVSDKNTRAQSFYHKLGFDSLGSGPNLHVGTDTLTSSIMALSL